MKKILSVTILLLVLSACALDEDTTKLSQEIRLNFDHSLITTTQPDEETLRLTFRADDELRRMDENSERIREIAAFAVENFEKGDNISAVIIVIDEPSMDATITAASRKVLTIQTSDL